MTSKEKTRLLNLISDGHIQDAIDQLLRFDRGKSLDREAIVIASRYKQLKKKERLGILSFEQSDLSRNQLITHLIDLIQHPEDTLYPPESSIAATHAVKPILWKYGIVVVLVAGMLFSLAEAFKLTDGIPSGNPLQLTVFVEDQRGNPALAGKGRINIALGNRSLNEAIGENGRVNFPDITLNHKGDTIRIGLEAEGWEIASNDTFVFTGESIRLSVKRDNSLGIIEGRVISRREQEFIEGAMVVVKDTFVYTDALGTFRLLLPETKRVKEAVEAYYLTIKKTGYKTKNQLYYPKSSDADIRLEKE